MCQKISRSVFEKRTEDIYGNKLWFATVTHGHSATTKEFILTKEVFNLKRWLFLMVIFSTIAFYCEFYTAVSIQCYLILSFNNNRDIFNVSTILFQLLKIEIIYRSLTICIFMLWILF